MDFFGLNGCEDSSSVSNRIFIKRKKIFKCNTLNGSVFAKKNSYRDDTVYKADIFDELKLTPSQTEH